MPIWTRLVDSVRMLTGKGPLHEDLDEEVRAYRDMLADEKVAAGMEPAQARREATLEVGGVEQVKESVRAAHPAAWLDSLARDIRFAFRLLAKTPGFSLTAIGVLGVGIGACIAVFTLVYVMLYQPMPGWTLPEQVVGIYAHEENGYRSFSYQETVDLRERTTAFEEVAAYRGMRVGVVDGETTRRVRATLVSDQLFAVLGVRLPIGRAFTQQEATPGSAAAVVILSDDAWHALGGSADIVGKRVVINARPFTVIGVTPPRFGGLRTMVTTEIWLPLGARQLLASPSESLPSAQERLARDLMLVGRLRPGVTAEAATASLTTATAALREADPAHARLELSASRLSRTESGSSPERHNPALAPMATLMLLAVVLLVIASLNVANMQLARGTARAKELAMRLALGAGRWRIVGQLTIEGLLLASGAAIVGLLAGLWFLRWLSESFGPIVEQRRVIDVTPDLRVVLATFGFGALSAVVFGLGPAWRLSRLDLLPELKTQSGSAIHGRRRLRLQHLLVAAQTALSLALLVAAGLFVRGAMVASQAEPGYRLDGQLLVRVDAKLAGYDEAQGLRSFARTVQAVRELPGVESAALASVVAFGNEWNDGRVVRAGQPGDGSRATIFAVGDGYFGTLGLKMRAGRDFTAVEHTAEAGARVVIIDEPLAHALFGDEAAVGRQIQLTSRPGETPRPVMQVVGVVPGLRQRLADTGPVPHIYVPFAAGYESQALVHLRASRTDAASVESVRRTVRSAVRRADPGLPVLAIQTLEEARDESPIAWIVRTGGQVLGSLGLMALVMAVAGLYGVKAYLVAQRTREIGIRMAIGARPWQVLVMVLREGAWTVGAAIVAGVALALALGRLASRMLIGVNPFDPLVVAVAAGSLTVAILCACYVPARRATRIGPMEALRLE